MIVSSAIMGGLALVLLLIGYVRGEGQHVEGIKIGANMIVQILPL